MMGGKESMDYLAPSGSGENTLVTCENGDYAADLEIALGVPRAPEFPDALEAPAEIETPDTRTCEALAALLSIDLAATTKAMPVVKDDGTLVLALLRGDDRLEEAKLQAALGTDFRPATDEEIVAGFGAEGGSLGPVGFSGPVVADETLRRGAVRGRRRTGPVGTCAGSRPAATTSPSSRTSDSRRKATRARRAAAGSASRPRSRSATSSSSAPATPRRSAPGIWMRTVPRNRS